MDIFFQDPNEVPLPPDEVRIRDLRAEILPDGRRVRVYIEVDPFQKRPSVELEITAVDGNSLAVTSVIESMTRKIELTMHLRGEPQADQPAANSYSLEAVLFYLTPLPKPEEEFNRDEIGQPKVVDRKQIQFNL